VAGALGRRTYVAEVVADSVVVVVGVGTGVLTTALKVLTTREQLPQSTELVEVAVEENAVLVASNGSSKIGCNVVHV
jgi:hypothetical protein